MMKRPQQVGMTLVEVLISMMIGVFLLGGVTAAYLAMRTTTKETVSMSEMQQNGRMALDLLAADIQQAGFRGMLPAFNTSVVSAPVFAGTDCSWGLNGGSFPIAGAGNFSVLWGDTLTAANALGCINDANANSDVIQIKRATGPAVAAAAALQANRFYLEASGAQGVIFAGTVAPPGIPSAEIWPYQHHVYYVTNENFDGVQVPVLARYQLVNNGGAQMQRTLLLDGIERIRFYYGTDMDNDNQIDAYIAADNMPAGLWQANTRVLAVKIVVLARALRPDQDYTNVNSYDLGDGVAYEPQDNFRRMLFSTTVSTTSI